MIIAKSKDTIYALSSGQSKSAVALIRVSGKLSKKIISKISCTPPKKPNFATLNKIKDEKGKIIDQTITTYFKAPKSFTGEDVYEISVHGGNAVIKKVAEVLKKNKARLAEPGEFTKRAFENNKLDLTQVEAISDLINSETEKQREQAYNQLNGRLSSEIKNIQKTISKILADVEAVIDFADEELPKNIILKIKEQIKNTCVEIENIIKKSDGDKKIRSGFVASIVGKPNTGKSSFINYLSDEDVAIVTSEPGTTRDVLESKIDIHGLPVRFYDTAGIRKSKNNIEKIGIEKTIKITKESDINIVFIENINEYNQLKRLKNPIFVQSKKDVRKNPIKDKNIINISSKNGEGVERLRRKIYNSLKNKYSENYLISRERHKTCLENSLKNLKNSTKNKKNFDLFAEDIRISLREISKIHGSVDIEDILDIIFSDFCIGK